MKFSFNRNALINEISIAQELISEKNSSVIYSHVLLVVENNKLTIKATDTKMSFIANIPVETEEAGSAVVLCSKLMGILSQLPDGDIVFEVQTKDNLAEAVIKHSVQKIRYKLWCKTDFVEIANFDNLEYVSVPASEFKDMISHTAFAVSNDKNKIMMNGVLFEKNENNLNMVATDGRRLTFDSKPFFAEVENFKSIIIHPKVLNIVAKHASDEGTIEFATTENSIVFKFSNYVMSESLIEGVFPNYRRVIPENQPSNFKVDLSEFLSAIKRISFMSDKLKLRIFLDITPGVLSIHAENEDGDARAEIPCEFAGENFTIAMNSKHLEEALKSIESERVVFEFSEALRAVTLSPEPTSSYFSILMPMQL